MTDCNEVLGDASRLLEANKKSSLSTLRCRHCRREVEWVLMVIAACTLLATEFQEN